ncbi:hypothetical protein GALMADRAFT_149059 [Galerina marginata CBS 339.88]|uniref:Uncharacterized protein n=1 Tax=Galerina marginata (strain CBS 339.88) TaxID=685588 RepID=A0A067S2N2_GALM3|nr:hypothetical protein GALMADRAFT_149059 [Galerina marginata CBS 339.88]
MAPFASFARAMSPSAVDIASSLNVETDDTSANLQAKARTARHTALLAANSLEELIMMIPTDYRASLRPHLQEVSSNASKRVGKKATLAKLRALLAGVPDVHQMSKEQVAAIHWPSHIQAKAPEIQLTKEFSESKEGKPWLSQLADAQTNFRLAILDAELAANRSNVEFLDARLNAKNVYAHIIPDLKSAKETAFKRGLVPVFAEAPPVMALPTHDEDIPAPPAPAPAGDGDVVMDVVEEGELTIRSWAIAPATLRTWRHIQEDVSAYVHRAVGLVEARAFAEELKSSAKKDLKAKAEERAPEIVKSQLDMDATIQRQVQRALAALKPNATASSSKKVSNVSEAHSEVKRLATERLSLRAQPAKKVAAFTRSARKGEIKKDAARDSRKKAVIKDTSRRTAAAKADFKGKGKARAQQKKRNA